MLNSPTGMRFPEEQEMTMLAKGASCLARHINERIRCEEKKTAHEGVVLKSVKEDSAFHALNPRAQLVLLHSTIMQFFDPHTQNPMTQFTNSALECVYSCLFYEVKREIDTRGAPSRRSVRNQVYYAWEYWFHGNDHPLNVASMSADDWIRALDKIAARAVFDQNYAKQFEPGYLPDITDQMVSSAALYFEQFV